MFEFLNLYNVLTAISIFATVLYIIKLIIFILIGGDVEVNADFDSITETDISFNFLSIQSILAFFMGFGWSGLAALTQFETDAKLTILIALIIGFAFMYMSAFLMYSIKKLNKTIKVDLNELNGKHGKAYTSIEPKAEGQIEIILNNKLSILNAINISDEKINSFEQIKVEKIENNQIYITKGE